MTTVQYHSFYRQRHVLPPTSFRKTCTPWSCSYPASVQRHQKNPQTCFEGPFGELLRATGPLAKANPVRFSTKYQDDETDLVYYGGRYLNTSSGRWITRDPIAERGGFNMYGFVRNDAVSKVDKLGLFPFCNNCKLNQVKVISEEWEIGTPDKTPEEIEKLSDALHELHKIETAANIIELVEGKPSIAFPKPRIDKQTILDFLAFQEVNLFGRIKYKVCLNVGPRFFFFGSDQLDWVASTQGGSQATGTRTFQAAKRLMTSRGFWTRC